MEQENEVEEQVNEVDERENEVFMLRNVKRLHN